MSAKPLTIIPLTKVGKKLMVLSSRKWRPEPGWCAHRRRTWLYPVRVTPDDTDDREKSEPVDSGFGVRVHGEPHSWGVLIELQGCRTEKPRLRSLKAKRRRRR